MLPSYFVIIGVLIGTVGSISYVVDTLRGNVKPNKVSFLMWSIAPFIAFTAQVKQGVGIESITTFSSGFFPLLIFLASFVNKEARVGNIAIFFSILADGLAGIPTIVKSYQYPETEIAWPWIMTVIGSVITLFTISQISFTNSAFLFYVIGYNSTVFVFAQFKIGSTVQRHR